MTSLELALITEGVIKSIQPGYCKVARYFRTNEVFITSKVGEEAIQRLKSVFPDNLILAALDLVDRDSGK